MTKSDISNDDESTDEPAADREWWAKDDLGYPIAGPFDTEEEAGDAVKADPDYHSIGWAEPYRGPAPGVAWSDPEASEFMG